MTEAQLHKAVADYLNVALLPPTWWTTFPLGGGGFVRGAQLRARGAKKGTPDILIIHPCKYSGMPGVLWLELKAAKGRVSDAQKEAFEALAKVGCNVFVCRSIDDVAEALTASFIPTRARAA